MDIKNMLTQLLQKLQAGRTVVDKSTALGRRQYLAPQDKHIVVISIITGKKRFQTQTGNVKNSLHHTLLLLVGQHLRVGTLTQQQSQRTQQDRLAGTSLASNDHKTAVKGDVSLPYQSIVLNM